MRPLMQPLMQAPMLALGLVALGTANLAGQSVSRDLPPAFRSVAGVTLDRDSAASIRATLGRTRERRIDTGRTAVVAWCYLASGDSSRTMLELMSDAGRMGTPGRELTVIRLAADAPPAARDGCARLPATAALATPGGLRLGLHAAQIRALLGRPTRRDADSLIYDFDAKAYLSPDTPAYEKWNTLEYRESCFDAGPPYANAAGTVVIVLRDDRAIEIRIERDDQSIC